MSAYPFCEAVQRVLIEHYVADPDAVPGSLNLVIKAYDCSTGCINEDVWDIAELDASIIRKFRYALYGILELKGWKSSQIRVLVEPCCVDSTDFVVLGPSSEILLRDGWKPWRFGHEGSIEELEAFFQNIANSIKPYKPGLVFRCPDCGNTRLQEYIDDVTTAALLEAPMDIGKDGEPEIVYETDDHNGGSTPYYQCSQCGYHICEGTNMLRDAPGVTEI